MDHGCWVFLTKGDATWPEVVDVNVKRFCR